MHRLPAFVTPERWVSGGAFGSGGVDNACGRPSFGSEDGGESRADGEGETGVDKGTRYRRRGISGAEWARGGPSGTFNAWRMVRDTAGWDICTVGGRGKGWNPPTKGGVVAWLVRVGDSNGL